MRPGSLCWRRQLIATQVGWVVCSEEAFGWVHTQLEVNMILSRLTKAAYLFNLMLEVCTYVCTYIGVVLLP